MSIESLETKSASVIPVPSPDNPSLLRDNRESSVEMLAIASSRGTTQNHAQSLAAQISCRHFRYRIPRKDADELRAADPNPCAVCDASARNRHATKVEWVG